MQPLLKLITLLSDGLKARADLIGRSQPFLNRLLLIHLLAMLHPQALELQTVLLQLTLLALMGLIGLIQTLFQGAQLLLHSAVVLSAFCERLVEINALARLVLRLKLGILLLQSIELGLQCLQSLRTLRWTVLLHQLTQTCIHQRQRLLLLLTAAKLSFGSFHTVHSPKRQSSVQLRPSTLLFRNQF